MWRRLRAGGAVRDISVSSYVEDAAMVLRCAEQIAHAIATDGVDEREVRMTLFGLSALIGLVGERLMLLRRMVVGETDPAIAWTHRISAPCAENDIVLKAWEPERTKQRNP